MRGVRVPGRRHPPLQVVHEAKGIASNDISNGIFGPIEHGIVIQVQALIHTAGDCLVGELLREIPERERGLFIEGTTPQAPTKPNTRKPAKARYIMIIKTNL